MKQVISDDAYLRRFKAAIYGWRPIHCPKLILKCDLFDCNYAIGLTGWNFATDRKRGVRYKFRWRRSPNPEQDAWMMLTRLMASFRRLGEEIY